MRPLQKKLLRDLRRLIWQVLAIALLIACGVAVAVMAFSAQESLKEAQRRYYAETRFADVFATLERAPLSVARRLAEIDGVAAVDPRVVEAGLMEVPGLVRPAVARVVSLPESPGALNRVVLMRGRLPTAPGEAAALKTFLDAAKVKLGDRLSAVVGGRRMSFVVVGSVLSPEYVYVPSPESSMPDDAHQAVFWMTRRAIEDPADMNGAFNVVALDLAPGASEPAVLARVDRVLAPYGGTPAYGREDQISNKFLEAEFDELRTSASILPPVFLTVAAVLVHLVVGRLVESEREQIGLLKAFGYSDWGAAWSYAGLAAAVGLLGGAGGGAAGAWFASTVTGIYQEYMRFPALETRFNAVAFLAASTVAIGACLLGSLAAVRRAARLSPAVAMAPLRPPAYRATAFDRIVTARTDQPTRMILRSLQRFPGRAAVTLLGLAASLSLLVGTQFLFDGLDYVIEHTYYRARRWSEAVGFAAPRDARAVGELARMPGVYAVEPVRLVPVRLRGSGREERVGIVGLDPDGRLERPLDMHGDLVAFKGRGLVLSAALAERLGAAPGGVVHAEITEGRRPQGWLPVAGVVEDYSGLSAYMDRHELNRLMGDPDLASGARLLVEADRRSAFYRAVDEAPQVVGASSRDETVANWRRVVTEAFRATITLYVGFAAAIAFGVAYNVSRIALTERARDLATLHVLGFSHLECAYILLGEVALLAVVAAPLGFLGGAGLAKGLVAAYSREDLRLPATITPESYGAGLVAYVAAVVVAMALTGRRIWTLDLVGVLKTRD